MPTTVFDEKYCLIGAGPAGLAAAKNLRARGIAFDCFDRQSDVGGNWNIEDSRSGVYESTHLISSKRLTEFPDFRMPRDFPHYPSHRQALAYLRAYAAEFDLYPHIHFNTTVRNVRPLDGGWSVQLSSEESARTYRGVVIANGHHWHPRLPDFDGEFSGELIHAREYRQPHRFSGKRVLVVGAGNTGCDIAVEVSRHAERTYWSLRRGYHFLPKFLFGAPIDRCGETMHRWKLPRWLIRHVTRVCLRIAIGTPEKYGLPRPDHALFAAHPIVNDQILSAVGHGRIRPKPNIQKLAHDRVHFADGTSEQIDAIVLATGYQLSFPFIDAEHLQWQGHAPRMFLNIFHPSFENLFLIGMIQPNGGIWALADYQAQLVARYISAQEGNRAVAEWFHRQIRSGLERQRTCSSYLDTPRHAIEVDYFDYRRRLFRWIRRFESQGSGPTESVSNDAFRELQSVS